MRYVQIACFALAFWFSLPFTTASAQNAPAPRAEYFGVVCQSEMLARSIGEGFREHGSEGFRMRASIATGNGCGFVPPYSLPREVPTVVVTSWVHENYVLILTASRFVSEDGSIVTVYGYKVSFIDET